MTSTTYYRLLGVWRELAVHRGSTPMSSPASGSPRWPSSCVNCRRADHAEGGARRRRRARRSGPAWRSASYQPVYSDDDDVIDGVEVAPAYPSEEMWEEVVARAKSRRRNLVTYITQMRDWIKIGEGNGTARGLGSFRPSWAARMKNSMKVVPLSSDDPRTALGPGR